MGCGSLIGAALSLAGMGAQEAANVATTNKENQLTNSELAKQQQFEKQARNVVSNSLSNSTPQAAQNQQQQGAQQFLGTSQQAKLPALTIPTLDSSDANNIAQQRQNALNTLGQNSNAQLQGYSNVPLQQNLSNLQTRNQLGSISSQAQDWATALPYQLQQAQSAYAPLSALGSALGVAGQLTGLSGLANGNIGGTPFVNSLQPASLVGALPLTATTMSGNDPWSYLYNQAGAPQF